MKNIYDIRKEKQLIYVLPDNDKVSGGNELSFAVAVAINLYYEDNMELYMKYINHIPSYIDVYVISSRPELLDKVNCLKTRAVYFLEKSNRGRDISALLVDFKKHYKKYKYICFLHDKKANYEDCEDDVNRWVENIWENMIDNHEYIASVLQLFEKNNNLGLLVPPEPVGEFYFAWYGDAWLGNYKNTLELSNKMKLNCNISEEKPPITIGTVFWAKTECLEKIFKIDWKYEDFPEEPMSSDGTVNHAIERIIGYVAQDAGYDTATIMNKDFAAWMLLFVQDNMRKMNSLLEQRLGIRTIHQLRIYEQQEERIKSFCNGNPHVYIYGAGTYGKRILQIVKNLGYTPRGFIVGTGRKTEEYIEEIKIYELAEIECKENIGVIIAVDYSIQLSIEEDLKNQGISKLIHGLI